jgi:hypothetical protein
MRKRLITQIPQDVLPLDKGWLNLDGAAVVEVTSEDKECPVEAALISGEMRGWRAADSGAQTIRLVFDESQALKRIALVFEETEIERTQEFVLRWSGDYGGSFQEIVRQQWNFSPPNSIRESRNIKLTCQGSMFWNWSLCPTSVGDRLAPRSRVCGCLDPHASAPTYRYLATAPLLGAT